MKKNKLPIILIFIATVTIIYLISSYNLSIFTEKVSPFNIYSPKKINIKLKTDDNSLIIFNFEKGEKIISKGEKLTSIKLKLLKRLNIFPIISKHFIFLNIAIFTLFFITAIFAFENLHYETFITILISLSLSFILNIILFNFGKITLFNQSFTIFLFPFTSLLLLENLDQFQINTLFLIESFLLIFFLKVFPYYSLNNILPLLISLNIYFYMLNKRKFSIALPRWKILFIYLFTLSLSKLFISEIKLLNFISINLIITTLVAQSIKPFIKNFLYHTEEEIFMNLSKLDHPLLILLSNTAPGTYEHSLIVSTIAERLAYSIGANPLLCRVGALYHDIGKIKKPKFFIENQSVNEPNPIDELTPKMAATIIKSHVTEGVKLAKEYNLPIPIIDIIKQHHGTTILFEFYNRQKQTEPNISQKEFQYPGPIPQTKEAALVMIADSIEAALRSLKRIDRNTISTLIQKVIFSKKNDGQFVESGLKEEDYNRILEDLIRICIGIYHRREFDKNVNRNNR